ncbi:TPA: RNA-binding S4 domain-containing protein [Neisseria meningitidis]
MAAYGVSDGIFAEQAVRIHRRFCGNFGYGGGRCYNNGLFLQGNIMEATVYLEDNEYIALCDLLKLAGLAESGGQAKAFIAEGLVLRNGETETRKTAKIRSGEVIEFDGARLEIADGYDPEA